MVLVDRPRNRRPRCLQYEHALNVVSHEFLSSLRVKNGRLDAEEGDGGRSGLRLDRTRERRNDNTARLGLPESVDDCSLELSDMLVEPIPRLWVDRLSDGTQNAQGGEIVWLSVVRTQPAKKTNGGRRGVELRKLVLLNDLPVARRAWVHGCRLEDHCADAIQQRAVDNVADKRRENVSATNQSIQRATYV